MTIKTFGVCYRLRRSEFAFMSLNAALWLLRVLIGKQTQIFKCDALGLQRLIPLLVMKRSRRLCVLALLVVLFVGFTSSARIFCRDECFDFDDVEICSSNGIYQKSFPSRCHLIQHNECFRASKWQFIVMIINDFTGFQFLIDYTEVEQSKC